MCTCQQLIENVALLVSFGYFTVVLIFLSQVVKFKCQYTQIRKKILNGTNVKEVRRILKVTIFEELWFQKTLNSNVVLSKILPSLQYTDLILDLFST